MEKITDREQEIVFTNFSDHDFDGMWAKKRYPFTSKKSYYLPFYLAEHFAKHLVDRELNKLAAEDRKKNPTADMKVREANEQSIIGNLNLRQELMDKCIQRIGDEEPGMVKPKEVPMREVRLKVDDRRDAMIESGSVAAGDIPQRKPAMVPDEEAFELQ